MSLAAGALFGAGLTISGMVDPQRVQAFLDPFGDWDPTLAFVMGGAMLPMAVAWRRQASIARPWQGDAFDLPEIRGIDRRLAIGAVVFGIGWGVAGLCPGPAIADLVLVPARAALFVAAMLAGVALHRLSRS